MVNRYPAFFFRFRYSKLYAETWRETESSCYSSQNSDDDVQDFSPEWFAFHRLWCLMYDVWFMSEPSGWQLRTHNSEQYVNESGLYPHPLLQARRCKKIQAFFYRKTTRFTHFNEFRCAECEKSHKNRADSHTFSYPLFSSFLSLSSN